MARLDFHDRVIILSDSILKHCEPPYGSTFIPISGAKIETFTRAARNNTYNFSVFDLCIIHVGTNDVDNYFKNQRASVRHYRNTTESAIAHHIFNNFMLLILEIRSLNRDIKIIISGIIPRPKTFSFSSNLTIAVNKKLRKLASESGYLHFHTTYTSFLFNRRPKPHMYDQHDWYQTHLSYAGTITMQLIVKNLVSLFEQGRLSFHN